jgi:hypothetical protein
MNTMLALGIRILYLLAGIGLALLITRFLVSRFEDRLRKSLGVITVVLFVLAGCGLFVFSTALWWATNTVSEKREVLNGMIGEIFQGNPLVMRGIPSESVLGSIDTIKALVPQTLPDRLHMDNALLDMIIKAVYPKWIDKIFSMIAAKPELLTQYAENDLVTVSSILNAIENIILTLIRQMLLRAHLILIGVPVLYTVIIALLPGIAAGQRRPAKAPPKTQVPAQTHEPSSPASRQPKASIIYGDGI